MKRLDTTPKLYSPAEAIFAASVMQAGDEEWTYRAKHDPKGTGDSLIEVLDENGEFVAYVS